MKSTNLKITKLFKIRHRIPLKYTPFCVSFYPLYSIIVSCNLKVIAIQGFQKLETLRSALSVKRRDFRSLPGGMRKLTTGTGQSKHPQTNAAFAVTLLIRVQNLKSTAKDLKGVYGVGQAGGGWERRAAGGGSHHSGAGHTARKDTYLQPRDGSPTVPEGTLRSRTPWSPFLLLGFFFFPDPSGLLRSSGCLGGVARLASALTS